MVQSDADMVDNDCQLLHQPFWNFSSSLPLHVSARLSPSGKPSRNIKQLLCSDLATKVFYWKIAWQLWWESRLLRMNCWKWVFALETTAREDSQNPLVWMMLIYLGHIECMFINWLQGSCSMANSLSMISLFSFPEIGQLQGDTIHILFWYYNDYCTPVNGPYK